MVIRRAQPSSSAPVIDEVRTEIGRNRISFEAVARSDAAGVVDTDLLYFWKIGAKTTMITPENFVTGQRIEIERPEDDLPVWLLVSDQRGGETWRRVWPRPREADDSQGDFTLSAGMGGVFFEKPSLP